MVAAVARKVVKNRPKNGKPHKPKLDPVAQELRRIYRTSGNRIRPPDVIAAARSPSSVLHGHFTWDDSKAAEEFRLIQARRLIATVRITIPSSSAKPVIVIRAYHALRSEQSGYRHMKDIVDAPDLLESLVAQFASDLERLTERYQAIRSTADARRVFDVIEEFCGKQKEAA